MLGIRRRMGMAANVLRGNVAGVLKAFNIGDWFLSGQPDPFTSSGATVQSAHDNSAVAYMCINSQAVDVASVPLLFLRDPEDATSEVPPTDPIRLLFENPNTAFSAGQFKAHMATLYLLRGEAMTVFDDVFNPKEMAVHYDPEFWRLTLTPDGRRPGMWEYSHGNVQIPPTSTADVMHSRTTNVNSPFRGQSPLQAAANPLRIDILGDRLNASKINRGGSEARIYLAKESMLPKQRREMEDHLRARRSGGGLPEKDQLLEGDMKLADPALTRSDLDILGLQGASIEKICGVYGMTPSLVMRDDSPNHATFQGRMKLYWQRQLVPMLHNFESSFDAFFVNGPPRSKTYVRFNLQNVEWLQEELASQVAIAKDLHTMLVPMDEINSRLALGLDTDNIPGSDDALVAMNKVPVSLVMDEAKVGTKQAGHVATTGSGCEFPAAAGVSRLTLTDDEIRTRAKDVRTQIARGRLIIRLERGLIKDWRALMLKYKRKAVAAANDSETMSELQQAFTPLSESLTNAQLDTVEPYHEEAAKEGQLSIVELLDDKALSHEGADTYRKVAGFSSATLAEINKRQNYIKGMADELFAEIYAGIADEIAAGELTATTFAQVTAQRFQTRVNRSLMIGRTEVGSMFNVARFSEMGEQGFTQHDWITAADGEVRDEDFDHKQSHNETQIIGELFSCGLAYPMQSGAPAGNVINCRCLTIPFVGKGTWAQEQKDGKAVWMLTT